MLMVADVGEGGVSDLLMSAKITQILQKLDFEGKMGKQLAQYH